MASQSAASPSSFPTISSALRAALISLSFTRFSYTGRLLILDSWLDGDDPGIVDLPEPDSCNLLSQLPATFVFLRGVWDGAFLSRLLVVLAVLRVVTVLCRICSCARRRLCGGWFHHLPIAGNALRPPTFRLCTSTLDVGVCVSK